MRFEVQTVPIWNGNTQLGWLVSVSGTTYKYAQLTEKEAVRQAVEEYLK